MKVIEKGHIYEVMNRVHTKGKSVVSKMKQTITFVNREAGREHDGTTTQEVLRVLIDRTRHCNNCMPHRNNEQVVYHLRMALVLHEARALERKVEKGDILPEYLQTSPDGHYTLLAGRPGDKDTDVLVPHRNDWDRPCNHDAE